MAKSYNDLPLLSERVKDLIKERNTTQVKLADYLGITARSFNRILQYKQINHDSLIKVSKFLDCNPYYLTDKTVGYTPFAAYERYDYNYDDCLKGLLHMQNYKPSDFTEAEFKELMHIVGRQIDKYSILHWKQIYNNAFWVPSDDGETDPLLLKGGDAIE